MLASIQIPTTNFIVQLIDTLKQSYTNAQCNLIYNDHYQLVVATILSAQCTDTRVNAITPNFFQHFPDATSLALGDLQYIEHLIQSAGLCHTKAKNLKDMAIMLIKHHNGRVPATKEQLIKLPGIGAKTANVILANAFGIPALAVDTHVYRIARRLCLSISNDVNQVEKDLCNLFPKTHWIELHHQLILHGRNVCHARKPNCNSCPLNNFCPTGLGNMPDPHISTKK
jgi:endonuclease-3